MERKDTVTIPQFGEKLVDAKERPGAYAVIRNHEGKILVVIAKERYHLPGGGIDAGEDPQTAVEREIMEETGYRVEKLSSIGKANQFLDTKDLGPINKCGHYFSCRITNEIPRPTDETDHVAMWITPEEFLSSTAHDFHKWAVRKALNISCMGSSPA